MPARHLAAFCLIALLSSVAYAANPVVEPTGMWSGKIEDESLRKLAPQSDFIADAETWKKLWTEWRPNEKVPEVDFNKELILVGTVPGPNLLIMRPAIDDQGNVKFVVGGTLAAGPGFGYKLIKIDRDGVKSVNGDSMEDKGVRGVLVIPKTVGAFEGHTLEIKLWEYHPLLADAAATLVDEFRLEDYAHSNNKATESLFSVGTKQEPRKDRRYYITVFVLKDGHRTHIGEIDGEKGLGKVLTDGKPSSVKVILRAV